MGENNKKIGNKLEYFSEKLFKNFGWELLAKQLEIKCNDKNHKNSKNNEKQTHGIDLLFKYSNPFNNQKEAVIVECKNHKWEDFIPSKINLWIEELLNTVECASCSEVINGYIGDCSLKTGLLLFNSSDNEYNKERAIQNLSQVVVPRKKIATMLLLADTLLIEKWYSLLDKLDEIKKNDIKDFGFIYPSIDSKWTKINCLIPELLFSDFIITQHSEDIKTGNVTVTYEIKNIFCFDKVSKDAITYIESMIETMQLASHNKDYKMYVYWYPETSEDTTYINNINKENDGEIKYIAMKNSRISIVDNGL